MLSNIIGSASRNSTIGSPTITASNLQQWTPIPQTSREPSAILIDFAPVITTFTPHTVTTFNFLYTSSQYLPGERLKTFLLNCPIKKLIECCLVCTREPQDYTNGFWMGVEAIALDELESFSDDVEAMQTLDLLGHYLTEAIDAYLKVRFTHLGFDPEYCYSYYFDRWIASTTAVLTHVDYNTANTG